MKSRKRAFRLEEAIEKMCRAVWLKLTYEEVIEWAKRDPEWYRRMTWTAQERDKYKAWFIARAIGLWGKTTAESEWAWFNLMYGWRVIVE